MKLGCSIAFSARDASAQNMLRAGEAGRLVHGSWPDPGPGEAEVCEDDGDVGAAVATQASGGRTLTQREECGGGSDEAQPREPASDSAPLQGSLQL